MGEQITITRFSDVPPFTRWASWAYDFDLTYLICQIDNWAHPDDGGTPHPKAEIGRVRAMLADEARERG